MNPLSEIWQKANLEGLQGFFVQLWGELCGAATLDSWQLRAMSYRSLMVEALDVIRVSQTFAPALRALTDVLDEARAVARRDPVIQKYFGAVAGLLNEPELRADPPDAARTRQVVEMTIDLLGKYESFLAVELQAVLTDKTSKEKKRLSHLANALATELSIRGYSRAFLETFQTQFLTVGFAATVARLFQLLRAPATPHVCYVPVNWPSFLIGARTEVATVESSLPVLGNSAAEEQFKRIQSPAYLIVNVEAKDPFAAVELAQLAAAKILSISALYAPNKNFEPPRQQILVRSAGSTYLLGPDLWHEHYVRDVANPDERIARVPSSVTQALSASLQYHYLGVLAKAPESRLTNFWIALETLFLETGGSIVERVSSSLPDSLALDYSRRQLQALVIRLVQHIHNLRDAGNHHGAGEILSFFSIKTNKKRTAIQMQQLLSALLDETRARRLFELCKGDELLIFRLNNYRDRVLSASKLKEVLEAHRNVVRWQLRRIYRGRNALVHRGELPRRAHYLIQNLHTYLVMALNAIILELGDGNGISIDTAWARRSALYRLFLQGIDERKLSQRHLLAPMTLWIPEGAPTKLWNGAATSSA